jgi:hypothetical protein
LILVICTLANSLWLAGCIPEFIQFQLASRNVAAEQFRILRRILHANAQTEFGRTHKFSSIRSFSDYQRRAPLSGYDDYKKWIDRCAKGFARVLTSESINLFEPTSGSTEPTKWIPYTASLRQEFQNGIRAWIGDLFLNFPDLISGQAYWSVSPANRERRTTPGGLEIGFEDDTAYIGGWQHRLVKAVMAVPSQVRLSSDLEAFRYITLLFLVRSHNLRLISIWNPSFLSLLLNRLPEWGDQLEYDLARGTVRAASGLPPGLEPFIHPDPRRAAEVRAALRAITAQERHVRLWPKLGLISCWADANAAAAASKLAELFPHSRLQGKGLIATEGFVSFPMVRHEDGVLAIRSHVLEFLPTDSTGKIDSERPQLAHQLERGQRYIVALTTGGGLYRYQTHDLIEVTSRFRACPLIRFLGRQRYVSDWFGEKLNEVHVSRILQGAFGKVGVAPAFAMLACETGWPSPSYVLFIDTPESREILHQVAKIVETGLCENFHYRYARQLGQLAPVRVYRVWQGAEAYLAEALRNGQRAGDVKPLALDRRGGWAGIFQGQFLAAEVEVR